MDSTVQPDRISNLPDVLLVRIISCLSFKDCVKTSVLSKSWRYLYHETKNVSFRESDFISPSVYDQPRLYARALVAFVYCMCRWISRINDNPIDSFEICISDPEIFLDQIQAMIAFAIRKRVKKLVLDFSHPSWRTYDDAKLHDLVVEVPESLYSLTTLESLRVCACKNFDLSKFLNPGKFKNLSFGWMVLKNLEPFLSKSSRLDSLSINGCLGFDSSKIAGNMRELVIENCDLVFSCSFNMPRVDVFRYSGEIFSLEFERGNTVIKEVYLDFGIMGEYDESDNSTYVEGIILCDFLNDLPSMRTLTVCQYLLQVIQRSKHPHLLRPMKVQHLVLKTKLHMNEFNGIWLLLNNCSDLETLTFDLLPPNSIMTDSSYVSIDPQTSWMQNITYKYVRNTVKVVVIKNFVGGSNELNLVKNLIRFRCKCELLLERVELYVPYGLDKSQKIHAYARAEMLKQSSKHVQVFAYNS